MIIETSFNKNSAGSLRFIERLKSIGKRSLFHYNVDKNKHAPQLRASQMSTMRDCLTIQNSESCFCNNASTSELDFMRKINDTSFCLFSSCVLSTVYR